MGLLGNGPEARPLFNKNKGLPPCLKYKVKGYLLSYDLKEALLFFI
jgi:hypothetical protein